MEKVYGILGGTLATMAAIAFIAVFVYPPSGIQNDAFQASYPQYPATESAMSLEEIFEGTVSGTVSVESNRENEFFRSSLGSGFVYNSDGYIITNEHVVGEEADVIVTFLDGRAYEAEVIGTDEYTDIAVLYVDARNDLLTPLRLGDSSHTRVGQGIVAIGNPFGLSGSMTSGIVSQMGRLLPAGNTAFQIPDVIQTDAVINPGNSGGPLLDMHGHVIGMNTAIQSNTGLFAGVSFAVPSQTIAKIVPYLIRDGEYRHPWIGVTGTDIDPGLAKIAKLEDTRGFMIIGVSEDSPAEKAGIEGADRQRTVGDRTVSLGGDVIVAIDDITVRGIDDILVHLQRSKSVGDSIILDILRDGGILKKTVFLEQRPDN